MLIASIGGRNFDPSRLWSDNIAFFFLVVFICLSLICSCRNKKCKVPHVAGLFTHYKFEQFLTAAACASATHASVAGAAAGHDGSAGGAGGGVAHVVHGLHGVGDVVDASVFDLEG